MPAAILARASLTFAFFGVDAYIPLALADVRGLDTLWIGASLTLTTLSWTAGAWTQERLVHRTGPRELVVIGHAVILISIAVTAVALIDGVPVAVAFIGWASGGLGIGLAYAPISLTVLTLADPGREGAATSSLQVTEQLGVSIGIGVGGAAVAAGAARDWDPATGIAIAWGISAVVAVAGMAIARRLPGPLPTKTPATTP
jgi:MFS family permease